MDQDCRAQESHNFVSTASKAHGMRYMNINGLSSAMRLLNVLSLCLLKGKEEVEKRSKKEEEEKGRRSQDRVPRSAIK